MRPLHNKAYSQLLVLWSHHAEHEIKKLYQEIFNRYILEDETELTLDIEPDYGLREVSSR